MLFTIHVKLYVVELNSVFQCVFIILGLEEDRYNLNFTRLNFAVIF